MFTKDNTLKEGILVLKVPPRVNPDKKQQYERHYPLKRLILLNVKLEQNLSLIRKKKTDFHLLQWTNLSKKIGFKTES